MNIRKMKDVVAQAKEAVRDDRESGYLGADIREDLADHVITLILANEKLQAFKDYVHSRLDAAGVPTDPESPHKAEGCRIGGRLDVLIGERDQLRTENERLKRGEFTPDEFQALCHHRDEKPGCTKGEFFDGCAQYQQLLFRTSEREQLRAEVASLRGQLEQQRAERDRLREGLKPFAAIAPKFTVGWQDSTRVDYSAQEPRITLGDCRRVDELLADTEQVAALTPEQSVEFRKLLAATEPKTEGE